MHSMRLIVIVSCLWIAMSSFAIGQSQGSRQTAIELRSAASGLSRWVAAGGAALLNADVDTQLPTPLAKWIQQHRRALIGASANPFRQRMKWGVATVHGDSLFLHVITWPEDGKLVVPRLHNSVKSIRLMGQEDELTLTPNVSDWDIKLPEQPSTQETLLPMVQMKLDRSVHVVQAIPPLIRSEDPKAIILHARDAIVHGEMLRFEPQPHKNTIGYWVKEKDWAEWRCQSTPGGTYRVELRYGCGEDQGGSEIEIRIGEEVLPFTVVATGGFQAWRDVSLGTVELRPGSEMRVTAKARRKAKNAVMDIQQITLVRVAQTCGVRGAVFQRGN